MTAKEKKQKAQDLIMAQIAIIGYGARYEEYINEVGPDAEEVLKAQMDRIARMFGFQSAWFS